MYIEEYFKIRVLETFTGDHSSDILFLKGEVYPVRVFSRDPAIYCQSEFLFWVSLKKLEAAGFKYEYLTNL